MHGAFISPLDLTRVDIAAAIDPDAVRSAYKLARHVALFATPAPRREQFSCFEIPDADAATEFGDVEHTCVVVDEDIVGAQQVGPLVEEISV